MAGGKKVIDTMPAFKGVLRLETALHDIPREASDDILLVSGEAEPRPAR